MKLTPGAVGGPLTTRLALFLAVGMLATIPATAGSLQFNDTTDTVSVSTGTTIGNTLTIEAVIKLTGAGGKVFNEWTDGAEDKQLALSSAALVGEGYPNDGTSGFFGIVPISLNTWHHIAYTMDGTTEYLFLDGVLIHSGPASQAIGNSAGNPFVGAIQRSNLEGIVGSMIGEMDSLRVSNIARYTASFTAPTGDMTSDANTLLLYNFNEGAGVTVTDLSGNGRTGTLGVGFNGATSPDWITATATPEPATSGLVSVSLAIFVACYRTRSRSCDRNRRTRLYWL